MTTTSECHKASDKMSVEEMIALIKANPPGPWPVDWAKWDNVRLAHVRMADEFVAELAEAPPPAYLAQRGIAICGGGPKYLPGVWVLCQLLREQGCHLPVQVWHLGAGEYCPTLVKALRPLGIEWIDARKVEIYQPCRILCGWEAKVYAAYYAPFAEVMVLDADNMPLRNPEYLFEETNYCQRGSMFFPDFDRWLLKPGQWRQFGLEHREEPAIESGQFLVNKAACWRELRLSLWYAEHSDYTFAHVYGDKEVFHLAWRRLGKEYAMPARGPEWPVHTIVQHDPSGQPIFHHRCGDKLRYDGNNNWNNLASDAAAKRHLEALRRVWDSRLWSNQEPTPREQSARQNLTGKRFRYQRLPHQPANFHGDEREIELLPTGYVGTGAAGREHLWDVHEWDGQIALTFSGTDGMPTMNLIKQADGVWRGRWLAFEKMPIALTEAGTLRAAA